MKSAIFAASLALTVPGSLAFATGDLSRNNLKTIVIEMGSVGESMYFKPNHLELETGKAYKLVLKNVDDVKHEFEAQEFVEKVFTRKVEVEWYIVPVQTGNNLELVCAIPGHKEAGMHGAITIN